ncbi:MAG: response regulator [Terriglobia bacterium]
MSRSILIIDDEKSIQEVARAALETLEGWTITTAGSGREGIDLAAVDPPDTILLDVMMPGMDGPRTLQELQATAATRSIPVLFLTATVQAADIRRFCSLGIKGVIAKPFNPLKLGSEIAGMLGWDHNGGAQSAQEE